MYIVYIYIYVCVFVSMSVSKYVYMYVCMWKYIKYIWMCVHCVCMNVHHIYPCVFTSVCVCVCVCAHARVYVWIYISVSGCAWIFIIYICVCIDVCLCVCMCEWELYVSKVKLATIVEGNPKAPFSIATTPMCRGGRYSFPGLLDPYPGLPGHWRTL